MIQRHVYLRLNHEHSGPEATQVVAEESLKLAAVPGVKRIRIARPVDEGSRTAWELCLILEFDTMADVEAYVHHPDHRAYVDGFLKPRLQVIKAWNFAVDG